MKTGRCQCGAIGYKSVEKSLALYICHCRECQRQSASAFGISLDVPRQGFKVTQGQPCYWTRKTDADRELKCAFCPICGSRLWHEEPGTDIISIKGGSLDEPLDLSHAIHVWVSRKLPGVEIPKSVRQFFYED